MTFWRYKIRVLCKEDYTDEVWAGLLPLESDQMVDAIQALIDAYTDNENRLFRIEFLEDWCDINELNWSGTKEVDAFETAIECMC